MKQTHLNHDRNRRRNAGEVGTLVPFDHFIVPQRMMLLEQIQPLDLKLYIPGTLLLPQAIYPKNSLPMNKPFLVAELFSYFIHIYFSTSLSSGAHSFSMFVGIMSHNLGPAVS